MENKNWNVYPDFQQDFAQAPPYYGPLSPLVTSQNPFNPQFNPYGFNNAARSPRIEYVSRIAGHYWLKQEDYNMLTDITMEKLIDRAFRNVNNRFGKSYYDVCADFSIPGV